MLNQAVFLIKVIKPGILAVMVIIVAVAHYVHTTSERLDLLIFCRPQRSLGLRFLFLIINGPYHDLCSPRFVDPTETKLGSLSAK
jgi:hypothetical protein